MLIYHLIPRILLNTLYGSQTLYKIIYLCLTFLFDAKNKLSYLYQYGKVRGIKSWINREFMNQIKNKEFNF